MTDSRTLLLESIRIEEKDKKIKRLRTLTEAQWEALLEEAGRHGLVPLLFHTLKPYYPDPRIPAPIQEKMRRIYYSSAARNMKLYQQLEGIVRKFAREEIPVILLKGAHLAMFVYDNLALRPMIDVDLLVKREDLEKVNLILIDDGYRTVDEDFRPQSKIISLESYSKSNWLIVEIHFHLFIYPYFERIDITELWKRAERKTIYKED